MSRLALGLVPMSLALAGPVAAQNAASEADRRVQGYITKQEEQAGVHRRCRGGSAGGSITVCAPLDPDANRLPRRGDRAAPDDGGPRAPEVSGGGIFKGPATIGNLCLLPPCPKDAVYFVDIESLPETPAGSDAEKVGKGQMRDR